MNHRVPYLNRDHKCNVYKYQIDFQDSSINTLIAQHKLSMFPKSVVIFVIFKYVCYY